MLKKTVVAAMAVAIAAAFAVTTSASASLWYHHSQAIENNVNLTFTGQAKFESGTGSVECQTTGTIQLLAGQGTANVQKFDPDLDQKPTVTEVCKAGGGLAFCQVHAAQATGTGGGTLLENPWVIHNLTQKTKITSGEIHLSITGGFCPAQSITLTSANDAKEHFVTGDPHPDPADHTTISALALHGQLESHVLLNDGQQTTSTVTVSGTQNIVESAQHPQSKPNTYSLTAG